MAISFGKCCQPLPGDSITGFITTGRGVSVHRIDCKNIPELMRKPERNIAVEWDVDRQAKFNVRIKVMAQDRANLLLELTQVMAKEDVNILALDMKARGYLDDRTACDRSQIIAAPYTSYEKNEINKRRFICRASRRIYRE